MLDWQKLHGENTSGFWAPSSEATLSNTGNMFTISSTYAITAQSLGQYLRLPIGFYHSTMEIERLKFNGYWEIWNNWFRDQNTQAPIDWKSFTNTEFCQAIYDDSQSSSKLMSVNKILDYFNGCLPSPQKGSSVLLPLAGDAPVVTRSTDHIGYQSTNPSLRLVSTGLPINGYSGHTLYFANTTSSQLYEGVLSYLKTPDQDLANTDTRILPANLYADLTRATTTTINDLRQGFAIQKLLEKDARGGSMYRQMLKVHFNVSIPDNTVQVPEYLGGKRVPLNMMQVLQTTPTSTSPLGTAGAFSNTADSSYICTKSFSEYGYLYILGCIRPLQSYSQGIPRDMVRNRRYDFYYPVFANLGEQGVKTTELYANNGSNLAEIFGYQECWAEYRYIPNQISGLMAYGSSDTAVQQYTYQNRFSAKPVLNSSFRVQDKSQIGNTFAVTTANYQFIGDFYFDIKAWRPMPYFSIPGLIDHH